MSTTNYIGSDRCLEREDQKRCAAQAETEEGETMSSRPTLLCLNGADEGSNRDETTHQPADEEQGQGGGANVVLVTSEDVAEEVELHVCGVNCAVCEKVLSLADADLPAADACGSMARRSIVLSAASISERRKVGGGAGLGDGAGAAGDGEAAPPTAAARCWTWAAGRYGGGTKAIEQKDQLGQPEQPEMLGSFSQVCMFGVLVVVGNQMHSWNAGFAAGFGSYLVAQLVTYVGFFAFVCCVGEDVATLSFPGGCYGLIRVTTGFYAGAMVGIAKATDLVFRISATVFFMGKTSVSLLGCDPRYQASRVAATARAHCATLPSLPPPTYVVT